MVLHSHPHKGRMDPVRTSYNHLEVSVNFTVDSTDTLKFDIGPRIESTLDDCLNSFWN